MDDNSLESIRLLNSAVVEDRLQAVRTLSAINPIPLELYIKAFGDQDWRVRKEAVRGFLSLPDLQRFLAEIIELLHDSENAGLRNSSIEILISLGSLAVPVLTEKIACPDAEVRKFIIDILGEIGSLGCEEAVLNALSDQDTNVRYAAVETLGKLKIENAVGPLLDLMETADTGLKFTILEALSLIGRDIPIDRLSCFLDDRVLRKTILDCFGRIGGVDVLPYLVEGLTDPMRKIREASLGSLATLVVSLPNEVRMALKDASNDLEGHLVELLNCSSERDQRAAIRLASMVDGTKIAQSLLPLLENDNLRDDVVHVFRSRDKDFFAQLLSENLEPEPMTRLCLIFLAGELQSSAALQLAIDALREPDPQLRFTAILTLGKIGDEAALEMLVERLQDENRDICDAAVTALEMFGPESFERIAAAVNPLLHLPDADLRMRAVRILGSIEGPSVEKALLMALKDPDAEVRCESIRSLRGCNAEAFVEGLQLALSDEVADVRRLSAEALGRCPGSQTLSVLSLAMDDQDPWVRAAAVRSLASFPEPQADRLLAQLVGDPVGLVVIAALETLAARRFELSDSFIEQALEHQDEEVVKASIDLLARSERGLLFTSHGSLLLNHSHRDVRIHTVQTMARHCGGECLPLLEQRLRVEGDALTRQSLEESIQILRRCGS